MAEHNSYFCSACGYDYYNRYNWCNLGCGSDYNNMIAVPKRHVDNFENVNSLQDMNDIKILLKEILEELVAIRKGQ